MPAGDLTLNHLSLVNFKNYGEAELDLSPRINCFVGDNGEGKTNLLDAIYYLSFCKSFFNPIDSQNIRKGEGFFVVQGEFSKGEKTEKIYCGIKKGQKKQFKRNKKAYERLADHIGLLPLVMISPADTDLIWQGSEIRRKFADGVIAQFNKAYLEDLINYNKVLSHRNALLKTFAQGGSFDAASMEVWDMQLVEYGSRLFSVRKQFLEGFIPIFGEHYQMVSGGKEQPDLVYHSKLFDGDFGELLQKSFDKDRMLGHTSVGVHKDDLLFRLEDRPLKKFGSQGQQKSFLIALKLAQFDYIKAQKEVVPMLLLDDIFDKLDSGRVRALMERVSNGNFGQVFITDTDHERLNQVFAEIDSDCRIFKIEGGATRLRD